MSQKQIKLGYEVGSGKEVVIKPSHLIVTGLTQKAGKTTTLESLIKRSKKRAVVFRTKIGEKSFLEGTVIPPYFKDRSDWQFIQGLVEATIKEKLRSFERSKIIQICKQTGGNSLLEFKKKIDERLIEPKLNAFEKDILTNIQAYLEIVLPKLQSISFSNTLELVNGLNIIDLERFSRDSEVQSLVIRSVLEEILYNFKDVIVVMPEAWKFIPQDRGNPCKLIVEDFIRQGATNGNYIWVDSQDMSGVDKIPLKQVTEWILGYQSEKNEVKHTLEQIPLPKNQKPKPENIMSLGTGMFYFATRDTTVKVYVQPFWLDNERAKQVALGKLKISELDAPETIAPFKIAIKKETLTQKPTIDFNETTRRFNKELSEISSDFFNKIADIQEQINKLYSQIFELKNQPSSMPDEDVIIRKLMQKMPTQTSGSSSEEINHIKKQIERINGSLGGLKVGSATYVVKPVEKVRKDFLIEIKNRIIFDVSLLNDEQRKVLKYIETKERDVTPSELITKCLLLKVGGSQSTKMSGILKAISSSELVEKTAGGRYKRGLMNRIDSLMGSHNATQEEKQQVYNHIIMDMLSSKPDVSGSD